MAEQSAAGATKIPPELADKAREKGWPLELVEQILAQGGNTPRLMRFMELGVTPDQARDFLARGPLRRPPIPLPEEIGAAPALGLEWMNVPTEWGVRVKPSKRGLTMGSINVGSYGEIPDVWDNPTELPRGAMPIPGLEGMGYSIYEKQEVWSDDCADLYEEAIQRRWRPATDIPWETVQPLPDDVERAMCQLCTSLSERTQVEGDTIARWLPEISYGFHEVKVFLSTAVFECGRHAEVFRKRALCNGGGLGLQSAGWAERAAIEARNYSEMVCIQMLLEDSFTLTLLQHAEALAHSQAEELIFRLCAQDKARHVAYAVGHLKFLLANRPERRDEIQRYLDKGEALLQVDEQKDNATREATAILLGGGKDRIGEGLRKLNQMRARQVRDYVRRLESALLKDRVDRLNPGLRAYLGGS
jgi:hypothetical protein